MWTACFERTWGADTLLKTPLDKSDLQRLVREYERWPIMLFSIFSHIFNVTIKRQGPKEIGASIACFRQISTCLGSSWAMHNHLSNMGWVWYDDWQRRTSLVEDGENASKADKGRWIYISVVTWRWYLRRTYPHIYLCVGVCCCAITLPKLLLAVGFLSSTLLTSTGENSGAYFWNCVQLRLLIPYTISGSAEVTVHLSISSVPGKMPNSDPGQASVASDSEPEPTKHKKTKTYAFRKVAGSLSVAEVW